MKNACLVVLMLMLSVPAMAANFKAKVASCAANRSVAPVVSVADFVVQLNASTPASTSGGGGGLGKDGSSSSGSGVGAMCEW